MSPQLAAFFAAHRTAVLGAGAAAVAGLAYARRKKTPATAGATAGARIPGTIPAAAVAPQATQATQVPGYDSTNYDVYNALQPELEALRQTVGASARPSSTPPIASTLFAPTWAGPLFRSNAGSVVEAEGDGSLYGLTPGDLATYASGHGGQGPQITQLGPGVPLPTWYDAASNLNHTTVDPSSGRPKLLPAVAS